MAKSNYGFIGAGGVAAVQKGFEDTIAARVEAQKLAHEQMLKEMEIDIKYGDLGLRRDTFKQNTRQWETEAPSQIQLREQQAIDLMRKPGEAVADHQRRLVEGLAKAQQERELAILKDQQETGRLGVQHGYSMDEIRERAGQQRATDAADPAKKSAGAAGEHLPVGVSNDLATMKAIDALSNEIMTIGKQSNWSGVGGLGVGAASEFLSQQFGVGSESGRDLRNKLGNMKALISAMRAGLTLTDSEKEQMRQYVADASTHPADIQSKLKNMQAFINTKRAALAELYPGATRATASPSGSDGGGQMLEYVRDASGKLVLKPKG